MLIKSIVFCRKPINLQGRQNEKKTAAKWKKIKACN